MIEEIVLYLVCFLIFVVLQSMVINGIKECFQGSKLVDGVSGKVDYQGMIFYMIAPKFFERVKNRTWVKPLWGCVKCMSSVWGGITFWSIVLPVFGFHAIEILVFIFDVFILVYLNYFFYKRI
jgi:hypothetical protein